MSIRQPSKYFVTGLVTALLAILLPSALALASESGAPMFAVGGFGTLGVVHSNGTNEDFTTSVLKPNGAGSSRDWSASVDSLIAAQITANFTPRLSAVLQVVAEQNYDNRYWPHVEWADIRYQFTSDFSVRAGRTVLQNFMLSDARKIGYASPWVRPPVEVYSLVPVTNSDGVDAIYSVHLGDVAQTIVASYGSTSPKIPKLGSAEAKRIWLVGDTIEFANASFHVAYQQMHVTLDYLAPLFDAFRQFGPKGDALAAKYEPTDRLLTFLALGATYDPGRWFITGEWGTVDFHSVLGKKTAWYANGGYRVGKFTPYTTYAAEKSDNLSDPGFNLAALPPYLAGPATGLNMALNSILRTKPYEHTISVGTRWDFMKNADLKLQFDHTSLGAGSQGLLINLQPGFQPGSNLNLFTATVDFVF